MAKPNFQEDETDRYIDDNSKLVIDDDFFDPYEEDDSSEVEAYMALTEREYD